MASPMVKPEAGIASNMNSTAETLSALPEQETKTETIIPEKGQESPCTTDPFIITFDHPSASHLNPKALSAARKYVLTTLVSLTSFTRILVSTVPAPALSAITASLNLTPIEAAMSMSIYLLATAIGPLLISPLSELYGRSAILHVTNIWFLAWNVTCGLAPNKGVLLAARFLAGFAASAAYTVGNGVLGDIWSPEQRGKSLGYYSVIPLIGAALGPVIGGVVVDHLSWRWVFYVTSIFQALLATLFVLSFCETYAPTLLAKQAARMRKEQNDDRYTTVHETEQRQAYHDDTRSASHAASRVMIAVRKSRYVLHALSRPLRLLLFHPVVQICGMSMAVGYGTLYIILTSLALLYEDVYDASATDSGLHYLAAALGQLVAAQLCGPLMDWLYARQKRRKLLHLTGGNSEADSGADVELNPEDTRMPLVLWTCLTPCIGFLLYGWCANYRVHWFAVDAGVFLASVGLQVAGMPRIAYLVDTYPAHVSSAIAAAQFLSSMTAFLFPLFTPALYKDLGYGWGNTLIAGIVTVVCFPGAWVLWKFGARMRARGRSSA